MKRAVAIAAFFALSLPSLALAQAWIPSPGDGYLELSYRQISGSSFYDDDGETRELASTYTQQAVGLYGEFGVIERWLQITAQGELFRRNELEDQGATSGLGDLRLGAWTGLLQGGHNLSLGLQFGLPTGDDDPGEGIDDPNQRIIASTLPTGDGNFDLTPTLAYGTSFGGGSWPLRHYFTAVVGYLLRTGDAGDSLEWRAELGIQAPYPVVERAWFVVALIGLKPLSDTSGAGFTGVGDAVTFTSFSVGLNVAVWRGLGVMFRFEGAPRARNIIAAPPIKFGLFWDF